MKHSWILLFTLTLLAACTSIPATSAPTEKAVDILSFELTDVRTQETFTLGEFKQPVLLENFAVWCPSCLRQQQHMQTLRAEHDGFTTISLNIDPTEDEKTILEHLEKHGFEWTYANAPEAFALALIDTYGPNSVSATLSPIILICPNGHSELLKIGSKTDEVLLKAVQNCEDKPQETADTKEHEQVAADDGSSSQEDAIYADDQGVKWLVPPEEIRSGGPPKDGIPAISFPKYVSVQKADEWIQDNELVLAISRNGIDRAYPLQILVWHEIVNDKIDDEPILVTYCPLCGSGIAYKRLVNEEEVHFGTTGKLYNSNLIMYDRNKEESYWTQIDGLAITGPAIGDVLTPVSIDTVVWRDWKQAFPEGEVLSKDTGFTRDYGRDPYGNYYEDSFLIFPVNAKDDRIHNKDVVFGITVNKVHKAYRESDLIKEDGRIDDTVGGVDITVLRNDVGVVRILDENGNEIIKERDFWFAWYAFHPNTQLYGFEE